MSRIIIPGERRNNSDNPPLNIIFGVALVGDQFRIVDNPELIDKLNYQDRAALCRAMKKLIEQDFHILLSQFD